MPQFKRAEKAERSPSFCVACGGNNAPFIDLSLISFQVGSANGLVEIPGNIYLCVGTPENPGCAVQIGRLTGQLVDIGTVAEMQQLIDTQQQHLAEANASLRKKTVTVGELADIGFFNMETLTASTAGMTSEAE